MELASLCTLPVGILRWQGAAPMLSVVVKATFRIDADGEAKLAERQEPLNLDESDPDADRDGLRLSCDFVPRKPRTDVLLVGHAHAAVPTRMLPVRLVVDVMDLGFIGLSATPTYRVPLVPRSLRASTEPGAPPIAVGPRAPSAPERAAHGLGRHVDAHGVVWAPLGPNPDFAFFNAAPARQQLGLLRPNAALWMEGLTPGGGRRSVELPGHRPRVFLTDSSCGDVMEVQLAIDTLWIDSDRQIAVLSFRGAHAIVAGNEPTLMVVALEPRGAPCGWPVLRQRLDIATRSRVLEPRDFGAGAPPASPGAHASAGEPDIGDEYMVTRRVAAAPARPAAGGQVRADSTDVASERVPTRRMDGAAVRREIAAHASEGARRREPTTIVLSDVPDPSIAAPPDATADRPRGASRDVLTQTLEADALGEDPLPFRRAAGVQLAGREQGAVERPRPPTTSDDDEKTSTNFFVQPAPTRELPFPRAPPPRPPVAAAAPPPAAGVPTRGAPPAAPPGPGVGAPPAARALAPAEEATGLVDVDRLRSKAVPFRRDDETPRARSHADDEGTGIIDAGRLTAGALPFVGTKNDAPSPREAAIEPRTRARSGSTAAPPASPDESTSLVDIEALRGQRVVPFADAPSSPVARLDAVLPPARAYPERFPDPEPPPRAQPTPRAQPAPQVSAARGEARMPLAAYVALKRAMWARPGSQDAALEACGLSLVAWLSQERAWSHALAVEVAAGEPKALRELTDALR